MQYTTISPVFRFAGKEWGQLIEVLFAVEYFTVIMQFYLSLVSLRKNRIVKFDYYFKVFADYFSDFTTTTVKLRYYDDINSATPGLTSFQES